MADRSVVGSGTFVRGRIHGTGDLEINGHVEGEVTVSGEVTVEHTGLVGAAITAQHIVVRGAVKGDLIADETVVLEPGARVVGNLRAPRITIAQGGLVRGHVQTGPASASRPRAAAASGAAVRPMPGAPPRVTSMDNTSSAASASAAMPRVDARRAQPAAGISAPSVASPIFSTGASSAASAGSVSSMSAMGGAPAAPRVTTEPSIALSQPQPSRAAASHVGPPPPVVPVLKKGTKALQKKR